MGRVFEVPDQIYELQEDNEMRLLGDPKELELESVRDRVREAVSFGWQKTSQVRDSLEEHRWIPSVGQVWGDIK